MDGKFEVPASKQKNMPTCGP